MYYIYHSKKPNTYNIRITPDLLVVIADNKKAAKKEIRNRGLIVAEWQHVSTHAAAVFLT